MKTNKSKKENQVASKNKQTDKTIKKTKEGKRKAKEAFGCQSQFQNVEQVIEQVQTPEVEDLKSKSKRCKKARILTKDKEIKQTKDKKGQSDESTKSKMLPEQQIYNIESDTDAEEVERAKNLLKFELLQEVTD